MSRFSALSLVLAAALPASAEDITFPNLDSSWNITSPLAWGCESMAYIAESNFVFSAVQNTTRTYYITNDLDMAAFVVTNLTTSSTKYVTKHVFDATQAADGEPNEGEPFKVNATGLRMSKYTHAHFKGGYWDFGGASLPWTGTYNVMASRSLTITDGAVVTNLSDVTLQYSSGGPSVLRVDGAGCKLHVAGNLRLEQKNWYGPGDKMAVSNGATVVVTGEFCVGAGGSNRLFVDGRGTSATFGTCEMGTHKPGSQIIISDHAKAKWGGSMLVGGDKSGKHLIRVTSGASLTTGLIYFGSHAGGCSNTLEVLDGGCYTNVSSLYVGGKKNSYSGGKIGNKVVVSNGVFVMSNTGAACVFGEWDGSTNNSLRVQGRRPLVDIYTPGLILRNFSELIFDLPADGYEDGVIPIVCHNYGSNSEIGYGLNILSGSRLVINGVAEYQERQTVRKTRVLLAKHVSNLAEGTLEATNATLPEGCTVTKEQLEPSNKAYYLVLTVKKKFGTMLIVR